jgi:hypothetical protein
MRNRWLAISAPFILSILTLPALARTSYQGSFERTLSVNGPANLEVYTHSGDVTIHAGAAGSIHVIGRIHVEDRWLSGGRKDQVAELQNNPPIHQNASSVKVDYVPFREISIDYEITVPADTTVRSETGSGNQTMDGLRNGINAHSGSGDLRLDDVAGAVHIQTGSGNIEAHKLAGSIDAKTGSGDMRMEETGSGDVRAEAGSGNIEIAGIDGGARIDTGSGDIDLSGKPSASWYVKAGSGNADLRLPDQAGFSVDVSTGSGTINLDHPVTTTVQGRVQSPQKSISGQVRGGGPLVTVHTGSGDIRIH